MNPDQVLPLIEHAIAVRQRSLTDCWHLTFQDGKFLCIPTGDVPPPFPLLHTFNDDDARHGFTALTWTNIKHRVAVCIAIATKTTNPPRKETQ